MKKLSENSWNYSLYKDGGDIILSVVCGNVGIFEINIKLNLYEKEKYLEGGIEFIEGLSREIQHDFSLYIDRHIGKYPV